MYSPKSSCLVLYFGLFYRMKKKDAVITVRVEAEVSQVIQRLAEEDDRTVAWMTRKLILEALEKRGLLDVKSM